MDGIIVSSKSLRKLTRRRVSRKEIADAFVEISTGDDRSAAISAGALVEFSLERAIKARLRRLTKAEQESLFEGMGPLATFSAKIRLGYALSIYPKQTRHDLETINEIRNHFAHAVHNASFKQQRVSAKCRGMYFIKRKKEEGYEFTDPRIIFMTTTRVFVILLGGLFSSNFIRRIKLPSARREFSF